MEFSRMAPVTAPVEEMLKNEDQTRVAPDPPTSIIRRSQRSYRLPSHFRDYILD